MQNLKIINEILKKKKKIAKITKKAKYDWMIGWQLLPPTCATRKCYLVLTCTNLNMQFYIFTFNYKNFTGFQKN